MNKLPNFFIIGAPKTGTTALSEYLRIHPQVFFSEPKEPHYFNDDFSSRHTNNYDTYLSYFDDVKKDDKAIGEGSVFYSYSKSAVKNILSLVPEAKFVIMIRNPLELVPSLHMEAIHSHGENIYDIEKAWEMEKDRKEGVFIPKTTLYKEALYYKDLAKLGSQIERLLTIVSRKNVHIIVFDDFKKDTKKEYLAVLDFLQINEYTPEKFEKINVSKGYKNIYIKKLFDIISYIKRSNGIKTNLGLGIGRYIRSWNTTKQKREPISNEFKKKLIKYYYEDVNLLSSILDRNLLKEWDFEK